MTKSVTNPSADHPHSPRGPGVAFWCPSTRDTFWFPERPQFRVGRQVGPDDLHLPFESISRQHAVVDILRERIKVTDLQSRHGIRNAGNIRVLEIELSPGDPVRLGEIDFVVVNPEMNRHLPDLERLVGSADVVHSLLATKPVEHVVLFGADTAPIAELAQIHHQAIAPPKSPYVPLEAVPTEIEADEILKVTARGRIYISGIVDREEDAPRLTDRFLQRLGAPTQRTALTVSLREVKHLHGNLHRLDPQQLYVPSLQQRLRDPVESARLIDAVFFQRDLAWRTMGLHKDLVHAIRNDPWTGGYADLRDLLVFIGRIWRGESERHAAEGLRPRNTVRDAVARLGFTMEHIRALKPD